MIVGLLAGLLAASAVIILYLGFRAYRTDPLSSLSPEDRALIKDETRLKRRADGPVKRLGARLGPSLGRLFGGKYPSWVESKIQLTDKKQYQDFTGFMAFKGSVFLLCAAGGVSIFLVTKAPLILFIFIAIGLLFPDFALIQSGRKRQEAIEDSLPDFLDVLAVTVSAGLSFRSAIAKVTERTQGPLADELNTVLHQLNMGETVYDAFSALRKRTTSESLDSFITTLLQAEELGAPLADTLATIALDMRQTTAQRARQKAAKASPKIAGVVTIIMVPGTMALIMVSVYFVAGLDELSF
ncbi:bacterial type II secretion system domain protein F [Brevibacterium mcbrellneri ATCC 49030]|uniref:Bacterial type II secretion system domain protein F n=1 Tax=Brevibacterium mcbrellneri ATCC 49030 TaxID=585530 RepID=D4YN46_9MICO|nr:type II secretion system F family protein [Brevibacterium mcbrellneri]EFG47364.1 bacterial type II secretion system domain protein F [Brevibacterium mcbrellneri ATCC 49030]